MDIARLEGTDGLVTVISQRSKDGALTFAPFREFDRQGERDRTSFVLSNMIDQYIEHLVKTKRALKEIEGTWAVNGTALPFPRGGSKAPAKSAPSHNRVRDRRGRR